MSRLAAALLGIAGVVHATLSIAALNGAARLEENVREIERSDVGGELYFSLGTWGLIAGIVAALELVAAWRLFIATERPAPPSATTPRGTPERNVASSARLLGLTAGFLGLGASFFSLPLFRWPVVLTIPLLLAATYVLAYRLEAPPASPPKS